MYCDEAKKYSLSLYERHIFYLDSINSDNRSGALQSVLDSVITKQEKQEKQHVFEQTIMWSSYGAIFIMLSYLINSPLASIFSTGIGSFLFAYGLLGGMVYTIQRARNNR